jgi:hypothetical protein
MNKLYKNKYDCDFAWLSILVILQPNTNQSTNLAMNRKIKNCSLLTLLIFNGLISFSQSKDKVKSIENQYYADLGNGYFETPF